MPSEMIEAEKMLTVPDLFEGRLNKLEIDWLRTLIMLAFKEGVLDGIRQSIDTVSSHETAVHIG